MNGVRKAKRKRELPLKKQSSVYAPKALQLNFMQSYLHKMIGDAVRIFRGHYSNADATRDRARITTRVALEGLGFACITLPTLSVGLFTWLEHGEVSFPQFKLQRGMGYPSFLGRLFHLAYYSGDQRLQTKAIDFIYSFAVSFKKLKGEYATTVIRELFADFVRTDRELGSIDIFDRNLRPVLDDARHQWRLFVKESGLEELIEKSTPQPGPGATNSPTKKNARYRPCVLYKQIDAVLPIRDWFYPNPWYWFLSESEHVGIENYTVSSPTARFKAVPKTAGKPRGICIEENEMQVMQQMVRKAFYKAIESYFGNNIALTDQTVNAILALLASIDREAATIDMKEASDRILRLLVSYMSCDNPRIRQILLALSTTQVTPPDEVKCEYDGPIRVNKYAPMGSALCFPVMSLVHMFLVRAIIRCGAVTDTRDLTDNVFVYGDDIIIPSSTVQRVSEWLPKFGMKLNMNKSFYKSHFRESCGVHAYNGVDITPVYVKYIPYHSTADAQASVFAVEALLEKKGFSDTAEFMRSCIEDEWGYFPIVPEGMAYAGYTRPYCDTVDTEYKASCRKRWSRDLQCYMYTVSRFKKRLVHYELSQYDGYLRWMWTQNKNDGTVGTVFSASASDSCEDLIKYTGRVPESALFSKGCSESVFNTVVRHPGVRSKVDSGTFRHIFRKDGALCEGKTLNTLGIICYL